MNYFQEQLTSPTLISHHSTLGMQQKKSGPAVSALTNLIPLAAFIQLIRVQVKGFIFECYYAKLPEPHRGHISELSMVY